MTEKKIDAMHKAYGALSGVTCKNCPHMESYCNQACTRIWHKCLIYGKSSSQATDWNSNWEACGTFTISPKQAKSKHLYGQIYRQRKQPNMQQVEGQISMQI